MSININGIELPEKCTVLEGNSYIHVYLRSLSTSTKELIESIQDDEVNFRYNDGDESVEYLNAKITYLGNNTLYVCSWIN